MVAIETSELARWLSLGQASRRLGVSPQMVDQYCRQGKLAYIVTPLGRLIEPDSVARLAKERSARHKRSRRRKEESPCET